MSAGGKGGELDDRLSINLNISLARARELVGLVWDDFRRGKISEPVFWETVEKQYGLKIPQDKRGIWNKWEDTRLIPAMADLVNRLKNEGYRVGLLSDTVPFSANEIRSHGGYDLFDFTVLSYQTGFAKPDPEIYDIALKQLKGIKADEVVFLDDQERNLTTARQLGIKTILVKNFSQAISDVEGLLKVSVAGEEIPNLT